jgi:hypothetical protein
MAHIVMVHGIAHEHRNPEQVKALERDWRAYLTEGLHMAGYDELAQRLSWDETTTASLTVRLAFYGDCFRAPGQMGLDPSQLDSTQAELAEQLTLVWLAHAAERASSPRDRQMALRELAGHATSPGQAQGSRAAARSLIRGLARLGFFARAGMALTERFIWRAVAQVTAYFTDDQIRETAVKRVEALTGPETVALIGHSLGSVVAFEAAHRLGRPLPLLITLGSPLGLRTVVYDRLRPQPPRFPLKLRRWVNVADRDDLIAVEPNLTGLFGIGAHPEAIFEGGWTVDNGASPHDAGFYLARAEVGRPIGQTLAPNTPAGAPRD